MAFDPYNPYGYPKKMEDKPVRFTFKCLSCKHKWTRDFTKHQANWKVIPQPNNQYYYAPVFSYPDFVFQVEHKCPECGYQIVKSDVITGKKNDSVPCDRRCTGATGHNCECSCGGKNHGLDHRI